MAGSQRTRLVTTGAGARPRVRCNIYQPSASQFPYDDIWKKCNEATVAAATPPKQLLWAQRQITLDLNLEGSTVQIIALYKQELLTCAVVRK